MASGDIWITTSSINIEAVLNPIAVAVLHHNRIPTVVHLSQLPNTTTQIATCKETLPELVTSLSKINDHVIEVSPSDITVNVTEIDPQNPILGHKKYLCNTIQREPTTPENDDTATPSNDNGVESNSVIVDVTPGRKYMSTLAFGAAIQYEADHIYYLFLYHREYGRAILNTPPTEYELIDLMEVLV